MIRAARCLNGIACFLTGKRAAAGSLRLTLIVTGIARCADSHLAGGFDSGAGLTRAREAPAEGEWRRRPIDGLFRVGILADGEFDEEAAAEIVRACPRGGAEIAVGTICRPAIQSHLSAPKTRRKNEMRPRSDPPFAISLDQEFPAVGVELDAIVSDAADPGARTRVVEPQLARGKVMLLHDPIRKDAEEGQAAARHDDLYLERRALGSVQNALANNVVRLRSEHEHDEAAEQHQRDDDQRYLDRLLHATHDRGRSRRWSSDAGARALGISSNSLSQGFTRRS